jgi:hypothetical protein
MDDYSCTFVPPNHGAAGGVVAVMMSPSMPVREQQAQTLAMLFMPQSSSQSEIPVHLSTYTPGEDFGRLAMLAKEFGLARIRNQKNQIRKRVPTLAVTQQQSSHKRQPALRYRFSGYSIWLELEQQKVDNNGVGDLDFAVNEAADEFRLGGAIPAPHVTALYGITTIANDDEAINVFREEVMTAITNRATTRNEVTGSTGKLWPDLDATGILVGAEFDGVNGGEMDMAWAEISFATSPEHETLVSDLYNIFYRRDAKRLSAANASETEEGGEQEYPPRSHTWVPHLSICYDNPEGFGSILTRQSFEYFLKTKCPTLAAAALPDKTVKFTRAVRGISLWKTIGTMAEWKCLDRFDFN